MVQVGAHFMSFIEGMVNKANKRFDDFAQVNKTEISEASRVKAFRAVGETFADAYLAPFATAQDGFALNQDEIDQLKFDNLQKLHVESSGQALIPKFLVDTTSGFVKEDKIRAAIDFLLKVQNPQFDNKASEVSGPNDKFIAPADLLKGKLYSDSAVKDNFASINPRAMNSYIKASSMPKEKAWEKVFKIAEAKDFKLTWQEFRDAIEMKPITDILGYPNAAPARKGAANIEVMLAPGMKGLKQVTPIQAHVHQAINYTNERLAKDQFTHLPALLAVAMKKATNGEISLDAASKFAALMGKISTSSADETAEELSEWKRIYEEKQNQLEAESGDEEDGDN